jgi:hypothetical protein
MAHLSLDMDKLSINLASYMTCVSILAFMLERIGLARFAGENSRERFSLRMDLFTGKLRVLSEENFVEPGRAVI